MSVSEKELTNHARAVNITAFEELISSHQNKVFSLAYHILDDKDDAADVQFQLTTAYFCDILLLVGLGSPGFKRLIPCPLNKHSRGEKLDVRSFQMA